MRRRQLKKCSLRFAEIRSKIIGSWKKINEELKEDKRVKFQSRPGIVSRIDDRIFYFERLLLQHCSGIQHEKYETLAPWASP